MEKKFEKSNLCTFDQPFRPRAHNTHTFTWAHTHTLFIKILYQLHSNSQCSRFTSDLFIDL